MKIAVLVKQVPDTWSERRLDLSTGFVDRETSDEVLDEISGHALEVALQVKDRIKATSVVVLTMSTSRATEVLRKCLSMGADSAVHIQDPELVGADLQCTSVVLAAALKEVEFDVLVMGNQSTDGNSGALPYMIAERLGLPALGNLDSVNIQPDSVSGERSTEFAAQTIHSALPALVSVTERTPDARFPNFRGIASARRKPVSVLSVSDLGVELTDVSRSAIVAVHEQSSDRHGIKVIDDGAAAAQLVEFLTSAKLI